MKQASATINTKKRRRLCSLSTWLILLCWVWFGSHVRVDLVHSGVELLRYLVSISRTYWEANIFQDLDIGMSRRTTMSCRNTKGDGKSWGQRSENNWSSTKLLCINNSAMYRSVLEQYLFWHPSPLPMRTHIYKTCDDRTIYQTLEGGTLYVHDEVVLQQPLASYSQTANAHFDEMELHLSN